MQDPLIEKAGIEVWLKRDDLIHPDISGNKWRKLKHHIAAFRASGKSSLLSFGGPYSNHLRALAAYTHAARLPATGIIRGERPKQVSGPLLHLEAMGMQLIFLSRTDFDACIYDEWLPEEVYAAHPYIIPEGGSGALGRLGCADIISELEMDFDQIIAAAGTGTTLQGIYEALKTEKKVTGIAVLKGYDFYATHRHSSISQNIEILHSYHFGGYARYNDDLLHFIRSFQYRHKIPLDYVYTGKMMWGIFDLIAKGFFKRGEVVIALHSGGIKNAPVV